MNRIMFPLALAVSAALAAPCAGAQSAGSLATPVQGTQSSVSSQSTGASQSTQQTGATQATGRTSGAAGRRSGDTTQSTQRASGPSLNAATPPRADEVEDDAMNPTRRTPPVQSQGAEQAAEHSAVAQHALWSQLDADGDGRISATEGGVNADFRASFEMMDVDHDGFISDTEYRAHAHTTHPQNRDDAAQQDPTANPGGTPTPAYAQSGTIRTDVRSGEAVNAAGSEARKSRKTKGARGKD